MLSIVIPIWNQHEMTEDCITAIRENTNALDYELILIDNGSEPPIKKPFTGPMETRLIRNEKNLGFPAAANQGIRAATGDIVILMNNDIVVTPGWEQLMCSWIGEFSIVAATTNYSAGIQAQTVNAYESIDELNDAARDCIERNEGHFQEVNFVMPFCAAIDKALFDEIGLFDESLWPCSGEDIDFCFRARQAGHRIAVAFEVYVHHHGSVTLNAMAAAGEIDYSELLDRNDSHIADAWGKDFWENQVVRGSRVTGDADGLRLNVGCGEYRMEGFVNIDQSEDVNPDLVSDAAGLPYQPNTVDEIYCGHMLEHLDYEDGKAALAHWFAILKPGGLLSVTVPCFDTIAEQYLNDPSPEHMKHINDHIIYSYVQPSPHRYCYSAALLHDVLDETGFVGIDRMAPDHPYFVDPVDWQIGMKGEKA